MIVYSLRPLIDRELFIKNISDHQISKRVDVNPNGASNPHSFILYNDLIYFIANDGQNEKLYVSDGSPEGTKLVNAQPNNLRLDPSVKLVEFGGKLYFSASTNGAFELWRFDSQVVEKVQGQPEPLEGIPTNPTQLTVSKDLLFFAG